MRGIFVAFLVVMACSLSCVMFRGYHANFADTRPGAIAILSYGSLVTQPTNKMNNVTLAVDGKWQATNMSLPVSLLRLSSQGTNDERATRVIDMLDGSLSTLWFAQSRHRDLDDAVQNLAGRE